VNGLAILGHERLDGVEDDGLGATRLFLPRANGSDRDAQLPRGDGLRPLLSVAQDDQVRATNFFG